MRMMTQEGEKVLCMETGKICYTEREAGIVINKARKHFYEGHMKTHKEQYSKSKEIPRRKYWCKACGFYHVTHMSRYLGDERISYREEEFYREYSRKKVLA